MQEFLMFTHTNITGGPWYLSYIVATIMFRFSLLPLVKKQMLVANNFHKCAPELKNLTLFLKQTLALTKNPQKRVDAINSYLKGSIGFLIYINIYIQYI